MKREGWVVFITVLICWFSGPADSAFGQIPPPGYDRAVKLEQDRLNKPPMDLDSVTLIDTVEIYDPEKSESDIQIMRTRYSIREYCHEILRIQNPDILLDHQPHTFIDPKTYNDIIIRLNQAGQIDTIPRK